MPTTCPYLLHNTLSSEGDRSGEYTCPLKHPSIARLEPVEVKVCLHRCAECGIFRYVYGCKGKCETCKTTETCEARKAHRREQRHESGQGDR